MGCPYRAVDEEEVPCRKAGLTRALECGENRQISGSLQERTHPFTFPPRIKAIPQRRQATAATKGWRWAIGMRAAWHEGRLWRPPATG